VFDRIPLSHRAHLVDGPARGWTVLTDGSPPVLTWEDADGRRHRYARVAGSLYRRVR